MRKLLSVLFLSFLSFCAFAQAVPDAEVSKELLNLLLNFKTLGPLGIGASVIVILTQLLKGDFFGNIFKGLNSNVKRLIITVLGQVYGLIFMVQSGSSWGNAAIIGLLSSGGAVAIWEAIKPLVEKKK